MNYKILTSNEEDEWMTYLLRLPIHLQDIYYTPQYYRLYENYRAGKAHCFIFEKDDSIALYPFLINSVNDLGYDLGKLYFDIQGAYGFNGVLSTSYDPDFIESFYQKFNAYCCENNIIAEFIRFNPIIKNQNFIKYIKPIHQNSVINVDLSVSRDQIWLESYSKDIRTNINNGIKIGYQEKIILLSQATDKDIEDFISIYHSTLDRHSADDFYYFDKDYIYIMKKNLPENALLGLVYFQKSVVACAIVPFLGLYGYGLIGGSLPSINKTSSFAFLIHNIILKLKDLNVMNCFLGGGTIPNDSIFRFKKGFSRHKDMDFFIGKKIHNENVYNEVVREWEKKNPVLKEKYKNILLKYRYLS